MASSASYYFSTKILIITPPKTRKLRKEKKYYTLFAHWYGSFHLRQEMGTYLFFDWNATFQSNVWKNKRNAWNQAFLDLWQITHDLWEATKVTQKKNNTNAKLPKFKQWLGWNEKKTMKSNDKKENKEWLQIKK